MTKPICRFFAGSGGFINSRNTFRSPLFSRLDQFNILAQQVIDQFG